MRAGRPLAAEQKIVDLTSTSVPGVCSSGSDSKFFVDPAGNGMVEIKSGVDKQPPDAEQYNRNRHQVSVRMRLRGNVCSVPQSAIKRPARADKKGYYAHDQHKTNHNAQATEKFP